MQKKNSEANRSGQVNLATRQGGPMGTKNRATMMEQDEVIPLGQKEPAAGRLGE